MDDRRKTSTMTLSVLAVLCVIGLVFGLKAVTADFPELTAAEEPACEARDFSAGDKVRVGDVAVSVYNAGSSSGAASKTMTQLIERGFGRGDSGNAPKGTKVRSAQIWADDAKDPAVRLVRRQLGRGTKIVPDKDTLGPGVVIVLGNGFNKLNANAPKAVKAGTDVTICSPPLE
ncbi:MAG: LytR C-terminal domain-containing protein [Nocardioides sp.]|nr:LytR C-terminal domain-containing protein [Nocardioides sp.]